MNNTIECLLVHKEEAKILLNERILLGEQILSERISSQEELEQHDANYYQWRDYNATLLKRIFNNEEIIDSHFSIPSIMSSRHKKLQEKVNMTNNDLRWELNKLKSTIRKIDLFEKSKNLIIDHSNKVNHPENNRVEVFFNKCKNHKFLSVIIIFSIIIISIAALTDSFSKLYDFIKPLISENSKDSSSVNYPNNQLDGESPKRELTNTKRLDTNKKAITNSNDGVKTNNQSIINSPGSIQAGRDIVINPVKNIINSLSLLIYIDSEIKDSGSIQEGTDIGLQSLVALFTKNKVRIRFASDFKIKEQLVNNSKKRLTFSYNPEEPSEIIGKEIEYLSNIEKLVVNYSEIFRMYKFGQDGSKLVIHLLVYLNGIEIGIFSSSEEPPGTLANGQSILDVSNLFQNIPDKYSQMITNK